MKFQETKLRDAFIIEQEPRGDERGFFARTWCEKEFKEHGLVTRFVQCNNSFSQQKGTLRGLHYQVAPHEEAKFMRCIRGAIYDVIVDLRPDSQSFTQWVGVELTADNRKMVYIPEGCAHGFQTLTDEAEVMYPVSEFYSPQFEQGIRWNDPAFMIQWPISDFPHVSEKDNSWPNFDVSIH